MHRLAIAALAIGTLVCSTEATARDRYPLVKLKDGLYAIEDGGVTCKVTDGWINCANAGPAQIACKDDRCKAYDSGLPPDELSIGGQETSSALRRVLHANTNYDLPRMGCFVGRHHIECRVIDRNGGFEMSRLFARCHSYDDAPAGWPWDGRKYTSRDIPVGH